MTWLSALSPDPAQIIPLEIELPVTATTPQPTAPKTTITPSATITVAPCIKMGETINLRTGVIYDKNHNAVPDGTEVKFLFTAGASDNGLVQQMTANTVQGVARTVYRIQNIGALEIRVVSEPATLSRVLRLNISASGAVAITAVTPTSQPTQTPTPTATLTPSPTANPHAHPHPGTPAAPGSRAVADLHMVIAGGAAGFLLPGTFERVDALGRALGAAGSQRRFADVFLPGSWPSGQPVLYGNLRRLGHLVVDHAGRVAGLAGRLGLAALDADPGAPGTHHR